MHCTGFVPSVVSQYKKQKNVPGLPCIIPFSGGKSVLNVNILIYSLLLLRISIKRGEGERIRVFREYTLPNSQDREKFPLCFKESNLTQDLDVSELFLFLSMIGYIYSKRRLESISLKSQCIFSV